MQVEETASHVYPEAQLQEPKDKTLLVWQELHDVDEHEVHLKGQLVQVLPETKYPEEHTQLEENASNTKGELQLMQSSGPIPKHSLQAESHATHVPL